MIEKLKSRSGESLISALAGVAIFSLATALLFGAVSASARTVFSAEERMKAKNAEIQAAELQQDKLAQAEIQITFPSGAELQTVTVDIYGLAGGAFASYRSVK